MPKTNVTFLLDRTGSMSAIKQDTIGGFNSYVAGMRGAPDIEFTLIQFDSTSIDKVYVRKPIAEVPDLNDATFIPRDMTPLIDAAYETIEAVERSLEGQPADTKVVITFMTDGLENASRAHTWDQLMDLIAAKRAKGWEFNFLGAGIDAYKQATRMGISAQNTMSYDSADPAMTKAAFSARGEATRSFAMGARADMSFSAFEKTAAGDKFDPAAKHSPPPTPQQPVKATPTGRTKVVDRVDL